ncbi:MAG: type II toxin-antitoxin system HicA family toxin [Candidatus Andersenbacteria bacterium]|nr:type II toxin-antitoxin system HicA family toxin [Candidatus Andersenbacteria bacterium]
MSRLKKVSWQEFEKFLLFIGCTFERQKGSHRVYGKPGLNRPVILPAYKELPVFVIKNNLRTLGMTQKQYEGILKVMK